MKRLLLVDDEEEFLKAMRIRLVTWGYDVLTATNGKEAIRIVKERAPDVVILDIMMPEMDGVETLCQIREFNKKIPVLMLTAYGDEEKIKKTVGLEISGFIPKWGKSSKVSEATRIALKGIIKVMKTPGWGMATKKILIVDDEAELVKAMRIRLVSWGYDVLTATSGKEAVRLVKREMPDAIILDIMMPEMDGIEALQQIRRFNKKIPVIMLTAYSDEERFAKTKKLGIAGFIQKGAEFENASNLVRVALKGQKMDK